MRVDMIRLITLLSLIVLVSAGCASPPKEPETLLAPTEEQMKIRNLQTRTFDIADRKAAMRGVIAALQDLGFIIERANEPLGLVTAARFAEPRYYDVVGVTVTQPADHGSHGLQEFLRHPRTFAVHRKELTRWGGFPSVVPGRVSQPLGCVFCRWRAA
jgi:hypothetical protein